LVITRNPDQSISTVPEAIFCDPELLSADGCNDPVGESDPEGSFDFRLAFHFVSTDTFTEKQQEKTLAVTAPGCAPQELRVRDRRGPYRVILDCPHRSSRPQPVRSLPVNPSS